MHAIKQKELMSLPEIADTDIAIIGMACRFPGSNNLDTFWQNLRDGIDLIQSFSDEELTQASVPPARLANPAYVKKGYVLDDIDMFDAPFFGMSPRDAAMLDPQHRLFLEHAWQTLEHAGYNAADYPGAIGVFGGCGPSLYLVHLLIEDFDPVKLMTFCGSDYLPTRVSYKLNLRGPSVNVQTTCSTSLVAIHMACQSLLNGECHMALAGGVTIVLPQKKGYLYQEGMVDSPDGYCRAFDAQAAGLTGGSGVGLVLLKHLEEALTDGDYIHAVIKGSAINNDGALKMDYMAPSVDGQAAAITEALAIAGMESTAISYVEAHGTATPIGDPIEIAALTQAFQTEKRNYCAIGSLKTNIGHTDTAAGVGGLIKTVLALQHQQLPPSLHFNAPNPQIDFANSPFYVNDKLSPWQSNGTPRRAGVSSFGIGGTNAHVVVQEAPTITPSDPASSWQLLLVSAKTASALETATANLANHLRKQPTLNLADVAYTLQVGRQRFPYRRALVCQTTEEAINALETLDPLQLLTSYERATERPVAFMFSGHGTGYLNMGLGLYKTEPVFREAFDRCCDLLLPLLGFDLRPILYPEADQADQAEEQMKQFIVSQPIYFAFEYALAQLWLSWGLRPQAMIGHSSGEYVAACLANVFTLEEGLALIAARARCLQQLPPGAMLSLPLSEAEVQPFLGEELSLALINGPTQCVVSGSIQAVDALEKTLRDQEIDCVRIKINYAAHSYMLDDILAPFAEEVKKITLHSPQIPYVSNVTGTWATAAQTTDPNYWVRHLRQTVRLAKGLQCLLEKDPALVLLEIGPGSTLSRLAQQQKASAKQLFFNSVRSARKEQPDVAFLFETLGQLWLAGVSVNWAGFYTHERRYRLPLPTYPFERQRYWITPPQWLNGPKATPQSASVSATIEAPNEMAETLYPNSQPEPSYTRPQLRSLYVAPTTETEHTIAQIWQEMLGFEQVGVEDNFFELGGDSLLATRIASQLRQMYQVSFSVRVLFETPTISALAKRLELVRTASMPFDEAMEDEDEFEW